MRTFGVLLAGAVVVATIAAPATEGDPSVTCPAGTMRRSDAWGEWCEKRGSTARHGPFIQRMDDGSKHYKTVEGTYQDGKLHGVWRSYHPNGQKSKEGEYRNGKEEGLWTSYHPNGQKSAEGAYLNGQQNGPWTFWSEDGSVWRQAEFLAGVLVKKDGVAVEGADAQRARREAALKDFLRKHRVADGVSCEALARNPYALEGKIVVVRGTFDQMVARDRAVFEGGSPCGFTVSSIPKGTFSTERWLVLIAGEVLGAG